MSNLNSLISVVREFPKTLFILCGFPYAGKSYIARQILKEADNLVFVSIDDIFYTKEFDWTVSKLPSEQEWEEIFYESYKQTKEALEAGKGVLYDSTNQTVASRNSLRKLAEECGTESQVIYVKSDIKTIWKRWEENQQNRTRSIVGRELVQQTIDMFEEPGESENVFVINN